MSDSFQNFTYVSSYLQLKNFAWKSDCPIFSKLQTSRLLCYFGFFRFLIYACFNQDFLKNVMKKLSFFDTNFQNSFQEVVYITEH